jgi:hypothetical protein
MDVDVLTGGLCAMVRAGMGVAVLTGGLCAAAGPEVGVGSGPQPNTATVARVNDRVIPTILSEKLVRMSQFHGRENDQGAGFETCPLTGLIRQLH